MSRPGPRRGERGVVGGAEGLTFGALILLAGTLVVTNVWSIVETRTAVDSAAREYLRAYSHGDDHRGAVAAGDRAARATLSGRGTPLVGLRVVAPDPSGFGPCGNATVVMSVTVPSARVPFLGELSRTEVRVTHSELIDAHRQLDPHPSFDPEETPCAQP